jgi:hypothetical protein
VFECCVVDHALTVLPPSRLRTCQRVSFVCVCERARARARVCVACGGRERIYERTHIFLVSRSKIFNPTQLACFSYYCRVMVQVPLLRYLIPPLHKVCGRLSPPLITPTPLFIYFSLALALSAISLLTCARTHSTDLLASASWKS